MKAQIKGKGYKARQHRRMRNAERDRKRKKESLKQAQEWRHRKLKK